MHLPASSFVVLSLPGSVTIAPGHGKRSSRHPPFLWPWQSASPARAAGHEGAEQT
ncbi:hypothetical protein Ga0080559_TMP1359 [Salipiger profundus]|uniref:Uncharacterized protein n=1 Tax=Salipiger profundus TaxID=1229727 RepID=A0A1U7D245_9RHOB|nr:hypothetical protein Ga0080559_TMP1359 [Salipiger profundus]